MAYKLQYIVMGVEHLENLSTSISNQEAAKTDRWKLVLAKL